MFLFQGRPGEKGQKGELGSPGFDVYAAVKVSEVIVRQFVIVLQYEYAVK